MLVISKECYAWRNVRDCKQKKFVFFAFVKKKSYFCHGWLFRMNQPVTYRKPLLSNSLAKIFTFSAKEKDVETGFISLIKLVCLLREQPSKVVGSVL